MESIFSDQLWKLTNDSKLENKGGIWQFSNAQWTLPPQGTEGVIETKNSSKVLGIDNLTPKSGSVVLLESFDTKKSDVQKWFVEQSDEQGWFTITNLKTGLILTAQKSDKPAKVKGRRAKKVFQIFTFRIFHFQKESIVILFSTTHKTAQYWKLYCCFLIG